MSLFVEASSDQRGSELGSIPFLPIVLTFSGGFQPRFADIPIS
jgi:hypothetical protein